MKEYKNFKIISNKHIGENVYEMKISGNLKGNPGQFYMVRNWELDPFLSRPFSICDLDDESITFLYMVVGRGTDLFSKMKSGDEISLLGPLGKGFKISKNKKIALVSGSVGIAPLYYLGKKLECDIDLYAGFGNDKFFVDRFEDYVDNIYISSDLGTVGFHGNVVELMKDKNKKYDEIIACGPTPMLKALNKEFSDTTRQLSLEARMGCGFGACLGCAVKTTEGIKRVCHDGPVFLGEEVIFDA